MLVDLENMQILTMTTSVFISCLIWLLTLSEIKMVASQELAETLTTDDLLGLAIDCQKFWQLDSTIFIRLE